MADRFHVRHASAGDSAVRPEPPQRGQYGESDPLAELARLIGQADPLADFARNDPAPLSPHGAAEPQFDAAPDHRDASPPGPPRWVQARSGWRRSTPLPPQMAAQHEAEQPYRSDDDGPYDDAPQPPTDYDPRYDAAPYQAQSYQAEADDARRYDEALYGRADPAQVDDAPYLAAGAGHNDGYDDGYGYGYAGDDGYRASELPDEPPRRGKLAVIAILALAVVGTGGAYAYRSLHGTLATPAEPPVIKADTTPIKVVPPTQSAERKLVQDRLPAAGGTERLVPREETPVDVASKAQEPRIVFPPLTRNAAPATVPAASAAAPGSAPGPEPRKIRTVAVHPDQPAAPAAAAGAAAPPAASAPRASAPTSLAPDSQTRTASINPNAALPAISGGYLVQLSSQRSEADARASYRILQGKFPAVLGNHAPVIKRADLGTKGVHYRAMVGPFGTQDQASQFCGNLKAAGGQCFVQRN